MITKPGVYSGLTMAEYLAIPAVSASVLRALHERCARAAYHESWLSGMSVAESPMLEDAEEETATVPESDATEAKDVGTIGHAILLEGSTACCVVVDPLDHPGQRGGIPKGWTTGSIKAARDAARARGKIPVLLPKMTKINACVHSAQSFIHGLRDTEPAIWEAFQPGGGESELTVVWQEKGLLCKLRADRTNLKRTIIIDPKFTGKSAEPDQWGRTQLTSFELSVPWYRRGFQAAFGTSPKYFFLVIETKPPYLVSMPGVDPHRLEIATDKIDVAFDQWRTCMAKDDWPGYPNRVVYPELPPWEETRWMERKGIKCDEQGIPYDPAALFERSGA